MKASSIFFYVHLMDIDLFDLWDKDEDEDWFDVMQKGEYWNSMHWKLYGWKDVYSYIKMDCFEIFTYGIIYYIINSEINKLLIEVAVFKSISDELSTVKQIERKNCRS